MKRMMLFSCLFISFNSVQCTFSGTCAKEVQRLLLVLQPSMDAAAHILFNSLFFPKGSGEYPGKPAVTGFLASVTMRML